MKKLFLVLLTAVFAVPARLECDLFVGRNFPGNFGGCLSCWYDTGSDTLTCVCWTSTGRERMSSLKNASKAKYIRNKNGIILDTTR